MMGSLKKQASHYSVHLGTEMEFWNAQGGAHQTCSHHKAGSQLAQFLLWLCSSHWRECSSLPSALYNQFSSVLMTAPQVNSGDHCSPANEEPGYKIIHDSTRPCHMARPADKGNTNKCCICYMCDTPLKYHVWGNPFHSSKYLSERDMKISHHIEDN